MAPFSLSSQAAVCVCLQRVNRISVSESVCQWQEVSQSVSIESAKLQEHTFCGKHHHQSFHVLDTFSQELAEQFKVQVDRSLSKVTCLFPACVLR